MEIKRIFLTIIFVKGIKIAAFNQLFESSGLRISMLWPTLAIPVGALLITLYTLKNLVRDIYQSIFWSKEKLSQADARLSTEKQLPGPDRS